MSLDARSARSLTRPLYLLELTDLTQPFTPQFAALGLRLRSLIAK